MSNKKLIELPVLDPLSVGNKFYVFHNGISYQCSLEQIITTVLNSGFSYIDGGSFFDTYINFLSVDGGTFADTYIPQNTIDGGTF